MSKKLISMLTVMAMMMTMLSGAALAVAGEENLIYHSFRDYDTYKGIGGGTYVLVLILTVVLPGCVDGVITGCILSVGRILGESAALLFTAGFAHTMLAFPMGMKSPGASLTVALYVYAKEQGEFGVAFAIAAILMILTLVINLSASLIAKHFERRKNA